jgi:NhaC family Na+:H+ antiporter
MSGVLGIATAAYLPYCFFNLFSPVISLLYGLTGFHIERIEGSGRAGTSTAAMPVAAQAAADSETGGMHA